MQKPHYRRNVRKDLVKKLKKKINDADYMNKAIDALSNELAIDMMNDGRKSLYREIQ